MYIHTFKTIFVNQGFQVFIKNKNKYFKRFKREEIKVPVLNILIENVLMFFPKV